MALKRAKAKGKGRIPNMDSLKIIRMRESKDMEIRDFLIDHMPKKVGKFYMDINPKHKQKEFGYYQYELLKCFDKTTEEVHLYGFELSK